MVVQKMKWEENVRRVAPYVPGEQPKSKNVIKLNTNECPYPPAPGIQRLAEQLDCDSLRLYPDTEAGKLADALCGYYGVSREQLFIGVGSDDVLAMAFQAFFNCFLKNRKTFFSIFFRRPTGRRNKRAVHTRGLLTKNSIFSSKNTLALITHALSKRL